MNRIDFDLSHFEEVELVPVADVHIGNPNCDEESFKKTIDYILEEPDNPRRARVCILNGDLTESVTRNSKGNVFEQTYSPQTQIAMMIKYLEPLAKTSKKYPMGKILSYCAGNHDFGRYNDTGITSAETIAVKLDLQERFSNDGCYSFVTCKRIQESGPVGFTVYNQHMTGGASTVGGKANRVSRISSGIIADIIVGSHVHTPLTFKEDIIVPRFSTRSLTQKTITYVVTNAFLRYSDYAERAGMKPASISVPKIIWRQERTSQRGRTSYVEVVL